MMCHSWITKTFLTNILKQYNTDNILEFLILPLSCGENFTSTIYKIIVTYENSYKEKKELSVILKCASQDSLLLEYAKIMKLFENEIDMYSRILPSIYNLDYVNKISALYLFASLTPQSVVILEDLTLHGYKIKSRHDGLDLNHCLLVIEKLAYLHASSIAISKKEPLTNFNLGVFWNNPYTVRWITIGVETLIKSCTKINRAFQDLNKYAQKLQVIEESFLDKAFAATSTKKNFKVLNHGDCWINNLMFSYKEDIVYDVILLDLQQCLYSNPAVDLNYFWATSPDSDVLINHFDYILDHYHKQLTTNLQKLNIFDNVPTKSNIKDDFKEHAFHGLTALVTTTAFSKSTKRTDATLENYYNFDGEDSFRHDCFNNKHYIDIVSNLLPFYENLGIFD